VRTLFEQKGENFWPFQKKSQNSNSNNDLIFSLFLTGQKNERFLKDLIQVDNCWKLLKTLWALKKV
jgi:hypothetical protein